MYDQFSVPSISEIEIFWILETTLEKDHQGFGFSKKIFKWLEEFSVEVILKDIEVITNCTTIFQRAKNR